MFFLILFGSLVMGIGPTPSTITQDGRGEISAEPDEGYLVGGVVTVAKTVTQALDDNARAMDRVTAWLKDAGINSRDIRTVQFDIGDHYRENSQRTNKDGYEVTHKVRVRVAKLAELGSTLDGMVAAGANAIDGIRMGNADAETLIDQARDTAVKDAIRRASLIARGLRCKLGRVLTVHEGYSPGRSSDSRGPILALSTAAIPTTQISAGSLSYSSHVTVQWELIPESHGEGIR